MMTSTLPTTTITTATTAPAVIIHMTLVSYQPGNAVDYVS